MLLKKVAVPMSNWYRKQAASPAILPAPDLCHVFDDIDDEQPWQPILSSTFLAGLGLQSYRAPILPIGGGATPSPAPALVPSGDLTRDERISNNCFDQIFTTYKDSAVSCRALRTKIRNIEVPALPNSKIDNNPMCLAWHIKGQCNSTYGRACDHILYTSSEYATLLAWCTTHFNTA